MNITIFQSVVLGLVQGLGEFLPISSTAHLALAPYFFHWKDPGLSFDVALHLGTLIAVVAYFYRDWINIFKLALKNKPITNNPQPITYEKNILWLIIIATIPGVLAGYFLEDKAETVFRNPLIIALALALAGLILYLADKYAKQEKGIEGINLKKSVVIGLAQAVAIIPGVSRSGATITAGLFEGLDRKSAARFSFLLSTPIIFGAVVLKLPHLVASGVDAGIIVGILASAVSGYLAIKYLIKFIEKSSYQIFFYYRLFLAFIIVFSYLI
ncbi:MAG: undecaprenyl-diphosphatase UppP [Patescibacteria group bacterium]